MNTDRSDSGAEATRCEEMAQRTLAEWEKEPWGAKHSSEELAAAQAYAALALSYRIAKLAEHLLSERIPT